MRRQLAGFPEYRRALLEHLRDHGALSGWRARSGDDLGLLLLEAWGYVLDVVGFYDEQIANESYLRTATRAESLQRLVALLGYQPRPALASIAVLAAFVDGPRALELSARTAFRSDAFDSNLPQVFETERATTVRGVTNEWVLGAVREQGVSGLLLEKETARLTRDRIALFAWPAGAAATTGFEGQISVFAVNIQLWAQLTQAARASAGIVRATRAMTAADGQTYIAVDVDPPPPFDSSVRHADVRILSPSLRAAPISIMGKPSNPNETRSPIDDASEAGVDQSTVHLDSVYKQIQVEDMLVVSRGSELRVVKVVEVKEELIQIVGSPDTKVPVTWVRFAPRLSTEWKFAAQSLVIHFNMVDGGKLTRVAKTELVPSDFNAGGLPLEGLAEPVPDPGPSELLLQDANGRGALVSGGVDVAPDGSATVTIDAGDFPAPLRTPVRVFGNVVRASRGESVIGEVLGSGDASKPFQSFTLWKKPLTYLADPAAPSGRRSTLEVRVNGILWREVPSFFGARPEDQVYIVRHDAEGNTTVVGGDGVRGERFPTGVDNVVATYRFGAGAAKPPAGAIHQLARPVPGLRRVVNPIAPSGGADADRPGDVRTNAPASALLLGRAVSIPDFAALARQLGVMNAHVAWAWDEAFQAAVVKVWFVPDGSDPAETARAIRASLRGQADPDTPITAAPAAPLQTTLSIDVEIEPRHDPARVYPAVLAALTDPEAGMLAPRQVPIGQPIFRSRIFEAILRVGGVVAVRRMTVDGEDAPFAIRTPEGAYHDFTGRVDVNGDRPAAAGRG